MIAVIDEAVTFKNFYACAAIVTGTCGMQPSRAITGTTFAGELFNADKRCPFICKSRKSTTTTT